MRAARTEIRDALARVFRLRQHCLRLHQALDAPLHLGVGGKAQQPFADCDGDVIQGEASGFHARVMQHEYDHLDGVLYTMRVTDFRFFGFNEELDRVAQAEARAKEETAR